MCHDQTDPVANQSDNAMTKVENDDATMQMLDLTMHEAPISIVRHPQKEII